MNRRELLNAVVLGDGAIPLEQPQGQRAKQYLEQRGENVKGLDAGMRGVDRRKKQKHEKMGIVVHTMFNSNKDPLNQHVPDGPRGLPTPRYLLPTLGDATRT